MAQKYTALIEEYCKSLGIEVPVGFYRHPASRYVVIDQTSEPSKLVAKTWFKQVDLIYYLDGIGEEKRVKILDFKDRVELKRDGKSKLTGGQPF